MLKDIHRLLGVSQRTFALCLIASVAFLVSCVGARIDGDGSEYLMTAFSFYRHGSANITEGDLNELQRMPRESISSAGIPREAILKVPTALSRENQIFMGFARDQQGKIRSIHFWLYSALASPFCALAVALGLNPAFAFIAVNWVAFTITLVLISGWLGTGAIETGIFVLSAGAIFYLRWTGPEVLTACCVMLAVLSLVRRDLSLAVLFSGLAASQNPSAGIIILATPVYWLVLKYFPDLCLGSEIKRSLRFNVVAAMTGLAFAGFPYLYSYVHFGVPSLIAQNYTSSSFLTVGRAFSFLFDANQGLAVGLPAIFVGTFLTLSGLPSARKMRWFANAMLALLLVVGMALPTLTATNWNSGYVVVIRYGYWSAMPLAALSIAMFPSLSERRKWAILLICISLESVVAWQQRWPHGDYLHNTRLANFLLNKFPAYYNPVPEIFLERESHNERVFRTDEIVSHRNGLEITKLIRHRLNDEWRDSGVCPDGDDVLARRVSHSTNGWDYYDGPFSCNPANIVHQNLLYGHESDNASTLQSGWSGIETDGVWTDGGRSVLAIPVAKKAKIVSVAFVGHYLVSGGRTRVFANNVDLGVFALDQERIPIPGGLQSGDRALTLTLLNLDPRSPVELGMSDDARKLSYFLKYLKIGLTQVAPVY